MRLEKGMVAIGCSVLGVGLLWAYIHKARSRARARRSQTRPHTKIKTVHVHKTINIMAAVESVFDFWDRFENFPQLMRDVQEITKLEEGRFRWKVAGPAGISIHWVTKVILRQPPQIIAWKTMDGSDISHEGRILFSTNREGGTRIDIDINYVPPLGALGHAIARVLGADPKSKMDEDLKRLKSLFEVGLVEGTPLAGTGFVSSQMH